MSLETPTIDIEDILDEYPIYDKGCGVYTYKGFKLYDSNLLIEKNMLIDDENLKKILDKLSDAKFINKLNLLNCEINNQRGIISVISVINYHII